MLTAVFERKEITRPQISTETLQAISNNAPVESTPPEAVLTQMITGSQFLRTATTTN